MNIKTFFKGKTILITGHTGFIGSWLSNVLTQFGARVIGYSLDPPSVPNLFKALNLEIRVRSIKGNILDGENFSKILRKYLPDVVFHLAAQPIVLDSIENPILTYETNVIGTAKVLESAMKTTSVRAVIAFSSDKSYYNRDWIYPYKETDKIWGHEPYSASKACEEMVLDSYWKTFYESSGIGLSSIRAGNIIGGGDWGRFRLIPDIVRALIEKEPLVLRNPFSTRPWQHVLDPISGILELSRKMWEDPSKYSGPWNLGPEPNRRTNVKELVETFSTLWGKEIKIIFDEQKNVELKHLALDISKAKLYLGYTPKLDFMNTIAKTVEWYREYYTNPHRITSFTETQIKDFFESG